MLTTKEAAEYLGVSVLTLYRTEKMGALVPYRTPGRHRRYSVEMLEQYLENSREHPPASQGRLDAESRNRGREVHEA